MEGALSSGWQSLTLRSLYFGITNAYPLAIGNGPPSKGYILSKGSSSIQLPGVIEPTVGTKMLLSLAMAPVEFKLSLL
jgi:hypothetical protein